MSNTGSRQAGIGRKGNRRRTGYVRQYASRGGTENIRITPSVSEEALLLMTSQPYVIAYGLFFEKEEL